MEIIEAAAGFLGGIVGGIVVTVVADVIGARRRRAEMTLDLFLSFEQAEMLRSRFRATELLEENFEAPEPQSGTSLMAKLPSEDWLHISRVRHFLEAVVHLLETRHLDRQVSKRLFGPPILRWFEYFDSIDKLEPPESYMHWRISLTKVRSLFS